MTQTSNRFFDEIARLMNDAAGVAPGRAARVRYLFHTQAERMPARPRRGQARGVRGRRRTWRGWRARKNEALEGPRGRAGSDAWPRQPLKAARTRRRCRTTRAAFPADPIRLSFLRALIPRRFPCHCGALRAKQRRATTAPTPLEACRVRPLFNRSRQGFRQWPPSKK